MADFNFYINRQGIQGRKGDKGETGFSPVISVGTDTPNEYKLIIANESNSFETPNLRGNINVLDNGGTYLRYDAETQQISAQGLDAATSTNVGGVLMSTDADIEGMGDGSVITPADLADALPIYLQGEGAVTITQDEETSKTKINVDLSSVDSLASRVSATEAEIVGIQADVADLDADNTDNKAIIDAHTNSIADINDSIASLQQTKQAKLTAGEGITIDSNNVISSTGGGGAGDVTAAGDNTFTGSNNFTKQVNLGNGAILNDYIPIEFGTYTSSGSQVMNRSTIQNEQTEFTKTYPSGFESYLLANTLKINGGYNLILDAGYIKDQDSMTLEDYTYKGKILDGDGNVILSQGNVTAGEGVTINKTDNGIEIVVDNSGGGSIDTSNLVTLDTEQTITGKKTFSAEGESRPNTLNIKPHIGNTKDSINNSFSIKGTDGYSDFLGVSCNKTGSYPYNVQTVVDFTSDLQFTGYRGGSTVSFGTSAWQTRPQTYTKGNGADGYKPLLHFGNITAGEGISITDNGENGITLSATGGGGSGSAPENMVTTDTDQYINSVKTFNYDNSVTDAASNAVELGNNGIRFRTFTSGYEHRIQGFDYTNGSLSFGGFGNGIKFGNSVYDKNGNEIIGGSGGLTAAEAAEAAMGSNNYLTLAMPEEGKAQTASAAGIVTIRLTATRLQFKNNTTQEEFWLNSGSTAAAIIAASIRVKKGDSFVYTAAGRTTATTDFCRFTYLNGSNPNA